MITVNAMGDTCPIPVVKTKKAIQELSGAGVVETLVDNEIAVQNLTKMAQQKGYDVRSERLEQNRYRVVMTVGDGGTEPEPIEVCRPDARSGVVVAISSRTMGEGDDALGTALMKSFVYALTQQDVLPETILFYNSGAFLTCEQSPMLEDLQSLEAQGVTILTCGTCLNHYGLEQARKVGGVTNMYDIVEMLLRASHVIKP